MPWRGPLEPGEFPTLGWLALDWIESTLTFTDGPKTGEPVRLYDEQAQHLLHKYRLDPHARGDAGNEAYQYRGSMFVRGQKWGKDPILAMITLFHAFGPCDFAGWDANGEPVGKPHPSPWVAIAALNDRQTDNTWLPLKAMVESSDLVNLEGVEVNLDMIRLPCGNPIEPLTTTAFGRLGGRFTKVSLTENGLMTGTGPTGASGKRSPLGFARTLIRSVQGMGGMWTGATNTWDPTEKSHAQLLYESKESRKRTYIDAKISRGRVDLADDRALREELLYLYGDSAKENGGHVSVASLMADCRDTEANGEAEIRRFFLSEIIAGDQPLVTPEVWAAISRGPGHPDARPLEANEPIALGFDGSRSRDATVITAVRISDSRIFHLRTWVPECQCGGGHEGAELAACRQLRVDHPAVDRAMVDIFDAYNVHYLYADPFKWQDYLAKWAGKWDGKVVEVPTNNESRMDTMVNLWLTALQTRSITHDGEATLTEHFRNAAIAKGRRAKEREDDEGRIVTNYLRVVKKAEGLHIDGAISTLLALLAREQAVKDGALNDPEAAPAPSRAARRTSAQLRTRGGFDPRTSRF